MRERDQRTGAPTVTTLTGGEATITLGAVAGAAPAPGAIVNLTAMHGSGATTSWTITYKPFAKVVSGPGANHSLGLTYDGAVFAWGYNSNGQLGDGTTTPRTTPVKVTVVP